MYWYIKCIKNYFNFKGRARRKEYWMFMLFNILIFILIAFITFYLEEFFGIYNFYELFLGYFLFIIIPHLAVVVRRLHDINKSGFYWFVRFIPLIGPIWLLILLVEDSWDIPNKWGDNPKAKADKDPIDTIGME